MKIFKLSAFVAVVLATMVFGCQPEAVGPKNKGGIGKSETGWDPHSGNLVDCMKEYCALKSSEMKFPDFNFYGGGVLDIKNNREQMGFCVTANPGWNIQDIWVWIGNDKSTVPVLADGNLDLSQFSVQKHIEVSTVNSYSIRVPLNDVWECVRTVVVARFNYTEAGFPLIAISTTPNVVIDPSVPMKAENMVINFCNSNCDMGDGKGITCEGWQCSKNPCSPSQNEGCQSLQIVCDACAYIVPSVKELNASTLRVDGVEGGTAPFRYSWSILGSASVIGTSSSLKVMPAFTTTYNVLVTDARGLSATRSITVNTLNNVSCDNNKKVKVCYSPPGSPNQWIESCVDAKKAGTYVPKLRYAGSGGLKQGSGGSKGLKAAKASHAPNKPGSKRASFGPCDIKAGSNKVGSNKVGSVKVASIKAGSVKEGSHGGSKVKAALGSHHASKSKHIGGSKIKANSKLKVSSKNGSKCNQVNGVGSLRGALGPCGSNGPVNPESCGE